MQLRAALVESTKANFERRHMLRRLQRDAQWSPGEHESDEFAQSLIGIR